MTLRHISGAYVHIHAKCEVSLAKYVGSIANHTKVQKMAAI